MMNRKTKLIQESNILLEKRYLNERSSDIRGAMSKYQGWTEKNLNGKLELSSYGEINDEFSKIIQELVTSASTQYPEIRAQFTAGNDIYHSTGNSLHKQGLAVDVALDSSFHKGFKWVLDRFKEKYPGFSYIDEYQNPSKGATGGHFHISYRKGNPETGSSGDHSSSSSSQTDSISANSDDQNMGAKIMKSILTGEKI